MELGCPVGGGIDTPGVAQRAQPCVVRGRKGKRGLSTDVWRWVVLVVEALTLDQKWHSE